MPGQRNANRQGIVRNGQQPLDFAYGHVMPQAPEVEKAVLGALMIEIEYSTRSGSVFTCRISDIVYSQYYGGGYIQAYREDLGEERTFKVSRIMKVNGHSFTRIYWNQIGDNFNRI